MGKSKIKNIIITFFVCYVIGACAIHKAIAEDNDTAFSANILPNAGTTTSNYSNANFDGVAASTGSLTNNSTHNGFTITCETQVSKVAILVVQQLTKMAVHLTQQLTLPVILI